MHFKSAILATIIIGLTASGVSAYQPGMHPAVGPALLAPLMPLAHADRGIIPLPPYAFSIQDREIRPPANTGTWIYDPEVTAALLDLSVKQSVPGRAELRRGAHVVLEADRIRIFSDAETLRQSCDYLAINESRYVLYGCITADTGLVMDGPSDISGLEIIGDGAGLEARSRDGGYWAFTR